MQTIHVVQPFDPGKKGLVPCPALQFKTASNAIRINFLCRCRSGTQDSDSILRGGGQR